MYKLTANGVINPDGYLVPDNPKNRHWQDYQKWLSAGNTPDPADEPTPEQIAHEEMVAQAPLTARQYFAAHPGAVDFIKLTPEEQATAIDAMDLNQLRNVVKYLTVAVSVAVKREFF